MKEPSQKVISMTPKLIDSKLRPSETLAFELLRPYKESYEAGLKVMDIRTLLYIHATEGAETSLKAIADDLMSAPEDVLESLSVLRQRGFIHSAQSQPKEGQFPAWAPVTPLRHETGA